MRGRLLTSEAALADYEILEMLLFLGIPRRDTKPLAKSLINQFGSLSGALEADRNALATSGLPPRAIEALELVVEAAGILAQPDAIRRPVIADLAALERYLDVPERSLQPPGLSALLLNNKNQLLGEPAWGPDIAPAVLTRELLKQALDQHATATIILRNSGHVAPHVTHSDRALHTQIQAAARPLSVVVHDYVVLGRDQWASLRQQGH
ncbi:MAG TPA: JAB domain-containing protein [Acetobacteraceae bacterium]|jgi:DNA repair protein RadC|nr:JAB domain-containing protein [Acetobacteraceae bacterium]